MDNSSGRPSKGKHQKYNERGNSVVVATDHRPRHLEGRILFFRVVTALFIVETFRCSMPVHSLHVFDRKGKTLFTKKFVKENQNESADSNTDLLAEQRKLVFGMLFSLREVTASLSPESSKEKGLQLIRTGAATLHTYETASGLRLALYVTDDPKGIHASAIQKALHHIYHELWIQCVIRSPLYRPTAPNVEETNFAAKLQVYLASQPWYKG
jgi:hypothetical protein